MGGSSAAKRSRKIDSAGQSSSPWATNGISTGVVNNNGSPSNSPGSPRAGLERPVNGTLIREKHEAEGPKGSKVASAVLQTTLPAWVNVGIMVGLIFGGCCANVSAGVEEILYSNRVLMVGGTGVRVGGNRYVSSAPANSLRSDFNWT